MARRRGRRCKRSSVWNREWVRQHLDLSRTCSRVLTQPVHNRVERVKSFSKHFPFNHLRGGPTTTTAAHTAG